jgi:hypothetical protein
MATPCVPAVSAPSDAPPGLSIVVTSRNDDHGGATLKRMRLFLQGLLDQTRRHRLTAELIVVEWNPPEDRPRLREVLPKPSARDRLTLRYVEVPASIHHGYRCAREIPLFQMIAKNVGIRRARGEFVLCTNVDLLFSDALLRRLIDTPLRHDTYYRANRCDVPDAIDPGWDVSRQLAWCEGNVIRRLGRDSRYRHINLELAGLQHKNALKKWLFDKMAIVTTRSWAPERRTLHGLDAFACGDFTLMSKEAWTAIEGYPELDLYSLHVDYLGLIAAASLGYRQHVFPREACTYHIDHAAGWQSMSPLEKVRFLERRPALDYHLAQEVGLHALARGGPLGLNPASWGYADVELPESVWAPPRAGSD